MKKTKRFVLLQLFFVLGMLNINAQTWIALEDVDYYLENLGYNVVYSCVVNGGYDGDMGKYLGLINQTVSPWPNNWDYYVPDEDNPEDGTLGGPFYGVMLFVHDANDEYCYLYYDYGLIMQAHPTYISDYEDFIGIYNWSGNLEEEGGFYSPGLYFMNSDVFLNPSNNIRVIIYTIE